MSEKKEKVNKGGQPLKFATKEILQEKIDAYFASCDAKSYTDSNGVRRVYPVTITGLALALGTNRQTLLNYEDKEEFFDTVKTAKTRVEHFAEVKLFDTSPAGAIFALKNYGWKDKHDDDKDESKTVVNIISAEVMNSTEWTDTYGK